MLLKFYRLYLTYIHVNFFKGGQLDQYTSNMQDLRSAALPDVIQQQQANLKKSASGLSGELRLFKCLTCGKDFKQKSTLLQVMNFKKSNQIYVCFTKGTGVPAHYLSYEK